MQRSLRRKILLYGGYVAFSIFSFVLFAYWTFPWDRVRDKIILEVEYPADETGRRRPSGYELEIVDLSPSWITGVELTGVRFVKLPETPEDRPVDVMIEEAEARISLLSLLFGTTEISYEVTIGGGTIEGELSESAEQTVLEAEIEQVNLRQLGIVRSLIGLPVAGVANGTIDVTLAEEVKDTKGSVSIDIAGVQIGDGVAKLQLEGMRDGITMERISAGDLAVRVEITEGVARIQKLEANGADARVDGSGTIRLLRPFKMSRLDMLVRFKFNDAFRNRNDRTRAVFSLLDFNPRMRAAQTPDGWLQYRLSGSFGSSIRPTPAGRARGAN